MTEKIKEEFGRYLAYFLFVILPVGIYLYGQFRLWIR